MTTSHKVQVISRKVAQHREDFHKVDSLKEDFLKVDIHQVVAKMAGFLKVDIHKEIFHKVDNRVDLIKEHRH